MTDKEDRPDETAGLYRSVFQHSAVSLWLQDISDLREIIVGWQEAGIDDLRSFLLENPKELHRAVHAISVVDVNDAAVKMYEVQAAADLRGSLDRTLNLDDPRVTRNMVEDIVAVASNRQYVEKQSASVTPSGRRLEIEIKTYIPPLTSPFPFMVVNVLDVTAREKAREELIWERSLLRALMDSVPDRIYFKDRESRFTMVNDATARAFGCDHPAELIGKTNADYFVPEFAAQTRADELDIMKSEMPLIDREEHQTLRDGRQQWFSTTKMPLRDQAGEIVGILGITRDISEKKLLEAQRIRAERLESLEQLAAGIAHYFNNINGVAIGYLDLVAYSQELPENLRYYLSKTRESIQRSVEITSRLGTFNKASQSPKVSLSIESLVRTLVPEFEASARRESVELRIVIRETTPVKCSVPTLEFVLRSVVSNALHALIDTENPTITISNYQTEGFSVVEVADTGCGMSQRDLTKVFTPFFSTKGEWAAPGSPQAWVKGSGLSLAVSRSLLAELRGTIEIESATGWGTAVRISLPL